jgi:alcohol dehydrogenase class IV
MAGAQFEFATATRIIFGAGKLAEVGQIARAMGSRALVITGRDITRAERLLDLLSDAGVGYVTFGVEAEPTIEVTLDGTAFARREGCDLVIGFGGGSVIDAGKAIAALLANPGDPLDYLEVIGRGQALVNRAAPNIAIPTTAGTGAEVTRNAVLASTEHRVKVSLRSPLMLPTVALVDPELTYSLPPHITAYTGLDALTQVIEPYVSHLANPLTDAICREGIQRAARSLEQAYQQGDDVKAREDMALVSLCGGLALANAKLGAVHGFAGPFGGMFHARHGIVCAALLPHVMRVNVEVLEARDPDNPALARYDEIAKWLMDDDSATAMDGAAWVGAVCASMKISGLAVYGFDQSKFDTLIEKAARSSSMKGNPIQLTHDEMADILERAL